MQVYEIQEIKRQKTPHDSTLFCADITTTACSQIVGADRNTVNAWDNAFRHKIMLAVLADTHGESGEFERASHILAHFLFVYEYGQKGNA